MCEKNSLRFGSGSNSNTENEATDGNNSNRHKTFFELWKKRGIQRQAASTEHFSEKNASFILFGVLYLLRSGFYVSIS